MVKIIYNCEICNSDFDGSTPFGNPKPQNLFLKRSSRLTINNTYVAQLPRRCYACDQKLIKKIERLIDKKRKHDHLSSAVDLSKTAWKNDLAEFIGPFCNFEKYDDWLKIKHNQNPYICNNCSNSFPVKANTFSSTIAVKFGYDTVIDRQNICRYCLQNIIEDLKKLY